MLQLSVRAANTGAVPVEERLYWAKIPVAVARETKVFVCVNMSVHMTDRDGPELCYLH